MNESIFLRALRCENKEPERPPIWLMRQAGRYMPEYRALREKYSLKTLLFEPELISEVSLQPIKRFEFDAAIVFSDICLTAQFLGLDLDYVEGKGPVISPLLRTKEDMACLKLTPDFDFIRKAIRDLKKKVKVPLIGFCAGAFTLASYMIEDKPSYSCTKMMKWAEEDNESFHQLLMKITDANTEFLKAQIEAGIDVIQIFESSAPFAGRHIFYEIVLPYLKLLHDRLNVPIIFYAKGTSVHLPALSLLHSSGIGLDYDMDLAEARKLVGYNTALQGNLNPDLLMESKGIIEKKVEEMFWKMGNDPGWIVNVGQGLKPATPIESVELFVHKVKEYR